MDDDRTKGRISLCSISKRYTPDQDPALSGVSMEIYPGEIHCLVGENGSGKSTLMHILSGYLEADSGEIRKQNDTLIRMVHQQPLVSPDLRVFEHLTVGHPLFWKRLFIARKERKLLFDMLSEYSIFGPLCACFTDHARVLSPLLQSHLSLASAVIAGPDLLVLDEPGTHLSAGEKEELFALLSELKKKGTAIVLVTHKLDEVRKAGDRITVLRKGHLTDTYTAARFLESEIPDLYASRSTTARSASPRACGRELLVLQDLYAESGREKLSSINLTVKAGEIIGITGMRGEGLDLLEQVLAGIVPRSSGDIRIKEKSVPFLSPAVLRKLNIGYIPTDRLLTGATAAASIEDNMILLKYRSLHKNGVFKQEEIDKLTSRLYHTFKISGGGPSGKLGNLSGGNIQRVIVSREFSGSPDIVIFAEPYWGLDADGKNLVQSEMLALAENGSALIIMSQEIDDVLELSSRIHVLYEGRIVLNRDSASISIDEIRRALLGLETAGEDTK